MAFLKYELNEKASLSIEDQQQMYSLMDAVYQKISEEMFHADLENKQFCGLLKDESGIIRGFTTYRILTYKTRRSSLVRILFSGDTVIEPAYWGSQELVKGWCQTVGKFKNDYPNEPLYWYLMSKGHRTYMYLPLFFKKYHPAIYQKNEDLEEVADLVSKELYPNCWNRNKGIIEFDESLGELKTDYGAASYNRSSNKYVEFFLEKNPGFHKGDELVCITEICPENLRGLARKSFKITYRQEEAVNF